MNEEYDVIILGTGLKECILSGLLSVKGKRVLHMDRNDYYGAESASLNLAQLTKKFGEEKADEEKLGRSKDYNVDLSPKFIMACGNLVKMLLHTKVTRYLEFKCVDGSFVYKDGKLHEVPVTAQKALKSSLMGMVQKRYYKTFLQWVLDVDPKNRETWKYSGMVSSREFDLEGEPMSEVFKYFKLDANTINFTGHAIALYATDDYLEDNKLTLDCIAKCKLYAYSLARYEKSPYIYPLWGLGGLPEGFSRLAAVHGGTYMLRRPIENILYNDDGTVRGVVSQGEEAYCKHLIGDPSYFTEEKISEEETMICATGKVARWLCVLDHPVPGTNDAESAQIILPYSQTNRKEDIYVSVQSNGLQVAPKGYYIAMISGKVFTDDPKKELQPAYELLGPVMKEFFYVSDTFQASNPDATQKKNIFIPSSMDATTHFESATSDVMKIYSLMMGEDVDLSSKPEAIGTDEQFS